MAKKRSSKINFDHYKPGTVVWVEYRCNKWPAVISRCYKSQRRVTYEFLPRNSERYKFSTSFAKVSLFHLTDTVSSDENKRLKSAVEAGLKILKRQQNAAKLRTPANTPTKTEESAVEASHFSEFGCQFPSSPEKLYEPMDTESASSTAPEVTVSELIQGNLDDQSFCADENFDSAIEDFIFENKERRNPRRKIVVNEVANVEEDIEVDAEDDSQLSTCNRYRKLN